MPICRHTRARQTTNERMHQPWLLSQRTTQQGTCLDACIVLGEDTSSSDDRPLQYQRVRAVADQTLTLLNHSCSFCCNTSTTSPGVSPGSVHPASPRSTILCPFFMPGSMTICREGTQQRTQRLGSHAQHYSRTLPHPPASWRTLYLSTVRARACVCGGACPQGPHLVCLLLADKALALAAAAVVVRRCAEACP